MKLSLNFRKHKDVGDHLVAQLIKNGSIHRAVEDFCVQGGGIPDNITVVISPAGLEPLGGGWKSYNLEIKVSTTPVEKLGKEFVAPDLNADCTPRHDCGERVFDGEGMAVN